MYTPIDPRSDWLTEGRHGLISKEHLQGEAEGAVGLNAPRGVRSVSEAPE